MVPIMSTRTTHKLATVARLLLGLGFTVFGLNFFLHFLPQPAPPPDAGAYLGALVGGHVLLVVKVVEISTGLLLLSNRFVPLALTLLAPILVGITLFHATFEPAGLPVVGVFLALELVLAWSYRGAFAPMLQAKVEPTADAPTLRHATA
jgi:uncharacterized membrane protein YphA (DoxX/SURF4 family)